MDDRIRNGSSGLLLPTNLMWHPTLNYPTIPNDTVHNQRVVG